MLAVECVTIGDFMRNTYKELTTILPRFNRTSLDKLKQWCSTPVETVVCPRKKQDFHNSDSPYRKRYEDDNWMTHVKECVFMHQYMDVKELVRRIHNKTKRTFEGTMQEDDLFYHDALAYMTEKATSKRM